MPFEKDPALNPVRTLSFTRLRGVQAGHWKPVLTALVGALGMALVQAQTALPDAGSLRQQIEQQREMPALPQLPKRVAPPPEIQPKDGLSVQVKTFRFAGNTLLSSELLAAELQEFLNRSLGFDGLQKAADAVAAVYRQAGWVARVYLPEQDVSEGVVTLQVVEARFAGLRTEGEPSQRVRPEEIRAYIDSRQAVGEPLNADRIDRGLLLADDLPGVSVAGTLEPGPNDGDTALVLQTTDEPLVYGDVGLDNTGARSTGTERLTVGLNVNSPTGVGELLSAYGLRTQGSEYLRAAVTMPLGHDGLRLGANVSNMRFHTLGTTRVEGRSGGAGLDLNYPLARARLYNLYLSGAADFKSFHNEVITPDGPQLQSDYRSGAFRVGLSGNWFDDFGGGGANSASLQGLRGRLLSVNKHPSEGSIEHGYHKLSYSLTRQQTLFGPHSLFLSFSGQQASQVLDSSERFFIGGSGSVRAYPSSEQGGDSGQLLTGEWRWRIDGDWQATAFADVGRVSSNAVVTSGPSGPVSLRGRGLSVSWRGPLGLNAKLTWAHRNGDNPRPNLGKDSDGTVVRDRFWLTLGLPF